MHLVSINSVEEQKNLEEHIQSIGENLVICFVTYNIGPCPGMGEEHFWTSGKDQAEEGK